MTKLQRSILYMVVYIIFVFTIEKFGLLKPNSLNISSLIFPLSLICMLSIVTIKVLQRSSVYVPLFLWMGSYLAIRFIAYSEQWIPGEVNYYQTIAEMALLALAVFLSHNLYHSLSEYEWMFEKLALPYINRKMYKLNQADGEIKKEFVRSRRHNRPLSLLVVEPVDFPPQSERQQRIPARQKVVQDKYVLARLVQLISAEARRTDLIIRQEGQKFLAILCPETSLQGSVAFGERLCELALEELGIQIVYGCAHFPEDALTFEDLLQKARFNLLDPAKLTYHTYISNSVKGE